MIIQPLTIHGEPRGPAISVKASLTLIPDGIRLSVPYGGPWPTLDSNGWVLVRGVVYFHRMTEGHKRRLWVYLECVQ